MRRLGSPPADQDEKARVHTGPSLSKDGTSARHFAAASGTVGVRAAYAAEKRLLVVLCAPWGTQDEIDVLT